MLSLLRQFELCHEQLNELFLCHQELLLQGKLDDALKILEVFWSCHSLHSAFEDEKIFPKYRELPERGRWDATLYEKEHQKIDGLYATLHSSLCAMIERQPRGTELRRGTIQLLDRQKSFKGLCEHHQEREEQSLIVELEAQAEVAWQENMARTFSETWDAFFNSSAESVHSLMNK